MIRFRRKFELLHNFESVHRVNLNQFESIWPLLGSSTRKQLPEPRFNSRESAENALVSDF
jgi:hypothetical protein